jgi:site-specific DNA-methyltransferase (adenine-specific)
MKYNPQKTEGKPYCQKSGRMSENWKGGLQNVVTNNESGLRHPKTIQYFCRDRGLHPTQKPVAMMEYLIKTYSNENDVVLDFTAGSFSTGIAAQNTGRRFIGIELDEKYFEIGKNRMIKNLKRLESLTNNAS